LVVEFATQGDCVAVELMQTGAGYIDTLAKQLVSAGGGRLALMGGLAEHMQRWLAEETRRHLVRPAGDALDGAIRLAAAAAGLPPREQPARSQRG
jgi:glucosamine kinase